MGDVSTPRRGLLKALKENRGPLLWTGLCGLGVIFFLYLFYAPPATDIGPAQPIPFSHHVHAGVKNIQCQFCHPYVGRSTFPGIPPVEKCLYCHKYIIAKFPPIQKEHWYFNTGTPTPWRKVNYLPEFVFFRHQRHIRKGIACKECHGAVETMDRIKGVRFQMGFCLDCHDKKKANVDCWLACHN
jgi:hypothetical protein